MVFINTEDVIGRLLVYITTNITGSEFLTYIMIILFIIAATLIFKLPLEFSVPIVMPLLIVMAMYSAQFAVILAIGLIYLAVVIGNIIISSTR